MKRREDGWELERTKPDGMRRRTLYLSTANHALVLMETLSLLYLVYVKQSTKTSSYI